MNGFIVSRQKGFLKAGVEASPCVLSLGIDSAASSLPIFYLYVLTGLSSWVPAYLKPFQLLLAKAAALTVLVPGKLALCSSQLGF